jgi:hypothetical protein
MNTEMAGKSAWLCKRGRQQWNTPFSELPEVIMLGYSNLRRAWELVDHYHHESFEFVVMVHGKASWEIGGKLYETSPGDVLVTRPNEMHRGMHEVISPSGFWWLVLRVPPAQMADAAAARSDHERHWLRLPDKDASDLVCAC